MPTMISVQYIIDGEDITASVTNRPMQEIMTNVNTLNDYLDQTIAYNSGQVILLFNGSPALSTAGDGIDFLNGKLINVAAPEDPSDGANKFYVDQEVSSAVNAANSNTDTAIATAQNDNFVESSEITFALDGTYTLAHGFGSTPKETWAVLKCINATGDFAVGEEVNIDFAYYIDGGTNNTKGIQLKQDPTNVTAYVGDDTLVIGSSAGNHFQIAPADWRLIIRARKI